MSKLLFPLVRVITEYTCSLRCY